MTRGIRFPIRLKILITLLSLISVVVGVITFTMTKSFHKDKTAYIHDLTSAIALHTAQETRTLFEGYRSRIRMYLLVLEDDQMGERQKARKMEALFSELSDFVAITVYEKPGVPQSTVYDEAVLADAHLTKEDLFEHRESITIPTEALMEGEIHVARSDIGETFPCLILAFAERDEERDEWLVAAAILRLDGLERLAARSRLFECYIVDSDGKLLAHVNPNGETTPSRVAHYTDLKREIRSFNAGMTKEYSVAGETVIGGLASSEFGGVVVGVQIPKRAAYLASRELVRTLMITSLVLLTISALVAFVLSRLMTRPLERLSNAAQVLGQGRFDIKVDASSRDEIGLLGNSFNKMASELKRRDKALAEAQKAVIQSEKMAAFGQLGAGIAHEVKNPLAGILGVTQLSLMSVEKGSENETNLKLIEKETRRCKEIIESLLKFARQEKSEHKPILVQSVIDDAFVLLRHQLEVHQVSLKKDVPEDLPRIMGNANQLQQVIVNLVINAQQAMDKKRGEVKITAHRRSNHVTVEVEDNGPGIPPDIQDKIFDPFFTTKRGKKGTGLGLSVTYGIVRDHQGAIKVESEVGKGTIFVMTFPITDEQESELAA